LHAFDPAAVAGTTRGGIDNVDFIDGLPGLVAHPQPTVVPLGAPLLVSGWTVDPVTAGPPIAVCVLVDRALPLDARTGIARGDIMAKHQTDEFVGYQLVVSTGELCSGAHELRTFALGADGFWYESAVAGFRVFQHHRALPRGGVLPRALRMLLHDPRDISAQIDLKPGTPIRAERWLLLQGWTYDEALRCGAASIVATDERGRSWSGPANIEQPAAREALNAAGDRLGFEIAIPAAVFGIGRHRLDIAGFDAAGRRYANTVQTTFDIIAAARPFPLTARETSMPLAFAAQLCETPDLRRPLPARDPVFVERRAQLAIEGWALDETGAAADEVFVELTPRGVYVPPQRIPAACAFRHNAADVVDADSPPLDNAWFRLAFSPAELPAPDYELALVVVQPGRRSYSRIPLAMLRLA
jgi:hypothetical protein